MAKRILDASNVFHRNLYEAALVNFLSFENSFLLFNKMKRETVLLNWAFYEFIVNIFIHRFS